MGKKTYDTIILNGTLVTAESVFKADLAISDGRIAAIGDGHNWQGGIVIDACHWHILPGVIDSHVHMREPGSEYKEDLETGSRAALLGGVTTICDMPNTFPSTTNISRLEEKCRLAAGRCHVDYGFWIGACEDNSTELEHLAPRPGLVGIKVYMAESTGDLLYFDDKIADLLAKSVLPVSFHAEDQALLESRLNTRCLGDVSSHRIWHDEHVVQKAVARVIEWCRTSQSKAFILHVSSKEELRLIAQARSLVHCEVTPQHLVLSAPDCYERLGTLAQMNPPIRDVCHTEALWQGVRDGIIDTIGSDHAPHTLEEKAQAYPQSPSGIPGCQTSLALMLDQWQERGLPLSQLVAMMATNPAKLLGLHDRGKLEPGYLANLTCVDLKKKTTITNHMMAYRCGWTPFDGMRVRGWPVMCMLHGQVVMREQEVLTQPLGQPITTKN